MKVSPTAVTSGTTTLSLSSRGRLSNSIATTAPDSAIKGFTKMVPARKAKAKPMSEPSTVFFLLKNRLVLPKILPKIEAVLSPSANIAMAALLAGDGKSSKVSTIPRAKNTGDVAKLRSSSFLAARRVIEETIGKFFPLTLAHSDIT